MVSLARWDDEYGDSGGYWLVRELPGFVIERNGLGGWYVVCPFASDQAICETYLDESPRRIWGEGWQARLELFEALPVRLHQPFETRSEALTALRTILSDPHPDSVLSEVIL